MWESKNSHSACMQNTNVMQGLVNIGKPCVLFLNKTKNIMMKSTSMWITREYFRFFKPLSTRGSLMTQFTNLDLEKNLQYIFISNLMLVIHKWSKKYTDKHSIIKHVLKVSNDVKLMLNFIYWKLHYLYVTWHNDNKVIWIFFYKYQ